MEQQHTTEDLRRSIYVHHIENVLRTNRLGLSSHLSTGGDTIDQEDMNFNVDGPTSRVRLKLRWKHFVDADQRMKHLNISLSGDRSKWGNAIRPVTRPIALQPAVS